LRGQVAGDGGSSSFVSAKAQTGMMCTWVRRDENIHKRRLKQADSAVSWFLSKPQGLNLATDMLCKKAHVLSLLST
jgi:hypothetical protein